MSVLTLDVGGLDLTVPCQRGGHAAPDVIGSVRRSFSGVARSSIRAELMNVPVVFSYLDTATILTIRQLFAKGAHVVCQGEVFNNELAEITVWAEITDEMTQGATLWELSAVLHEVSNADTTPTIDEPPSVSTLLGWYDAQGPNFAGLGLSNTDSLTPLWPDETANANDALAGNGSFTGTLDTTAMNGFPGVRFDFLGNNQRGYSAVYAPTQGEAFIVMRRDVAWPNDGAFWGFGQTAVSSHVPTTAGGTMRDHFGSTQSHSFTIGTDPTVPFLYHVRAKAGQWRCWVNGVLKYSTAINTVSFQVPAWGEFLAGGAFYNAYIGWIGELKLYSGFMAPTDAAAEEAALMTKWGIV